MTRNDLRTGRPTAAKGASARWPRWLDSIWHALLCGGVASYAIHDEFPPTVRWISLGLGLWLITTRREP